MGVSTITPVPQWENIASASIAPATTIASAAASALDVSTSIASDIPVVGSVVSAIVSIVKLFFHGANPNQVYSAQLEQVAESASLNIQALVKAGYIDVQTGVVITQTILNEAIGSMTNLQAKIGNLGGMANMTKTINAIILTTQSLPVIPLVPFTPQQAQALFLQPGTPGWGYPQSLTQGQQLTEQILENYVQPSQSVAGGLVEATPATIASNTVSSALTGNFSNLEGLIISYPLYFLIGAIILYFLFRNR